MSGEGVSNPPVITAHLTAVEIRDAIVGLDDNDRKIVITDPASGEHKVYAIHKTAGGKLRVKHKAVAEV